MRQCNKDSRKYEDTNNLEDNKIVTGIAGTVKFNINSDEDFRYNIVSFKWSKTSWILIGEMFCCSAYLVDESLNTAMGIIKSAIKNGNYGIYVLKRIKIIPLQFQKLKNLLLLQVREQRSNVDWRKQE